MIKFPSKWEKSERDSFRKRFKKVLSPDNINREDLQRATSLIRTYSQKMGQISRKLTDKDAVMMNGVVHAIQNHEPYRARMLANELSELRKMNKMVSQARLAFEQIILRFETVSDLGDIAITLSPAVSAIKGVQSNLSSVIPEAEGEISEISEVLSTLVSDSGQLGGADQISFEPTSSDSENILAEASLVLMQSIKEKFPEAPEGSQEAEYEPT